MPRPKHLGLPCPRCGGLRTRVVDTQLADDLVRRSRLCKGCGRRFATHEATATAGVSEPARNRIIATARRLEALTQDDRLVLLRIIEAFESANAAFPTPAFSPLHMQAAE